MFEAVLLLYLFCKTYNWKSLPFCTRTFVKQRGSGNAKQSFISKEITMYIIEWTIWGISFLILLIQIKLLGSKDGTVQLLAKRFSYFIIFGLIITAILNVSKFHLIWWMPFTYFLNLKLFINKVMRSNTTTVEFQSEIGRDIKWKNIYKHVFKIISFDRNGTAINSNGKVIKKGILKPYGFLVVECPILNNQTRLPIIHRDDFLLVSSIYDDPVWSNRLIDLDFLVTYFPKSILSNGHTSSGLHVLHYLLTNKNKLKFFYENYPANFSSPKPELIFNEIKWEGEIGVQTNFE